MMRFWGELSLFLLLVFGSLLLGGCATSAVVKGKIFGLVEKDLRAGYELALANKDLLGTEDAWGKCYLKVADSIKSVGGVNSEEGLIFTLAMKIHILESMKSGLEEDVKAACGAVFFDIMLNAAERLPGH